MISNELRTGEERPSLDQCIPVWQAYNSEVHSEEHNHHEKHVAMDNSHTHTPSSDISTLYMDLYKRALKLVCISDT